MGILVFIPEDKANSSIDDEVLLHYAENDYKAAVVSRDKFDDHKKKGEWLNAINRYTFCY